MSWAFCCCWENFYYWFIAFLVKAIGLFNFPVYSLIFDGYVFIGIHSFPFSFCYWSLAWLTMVKNFSIVSFTLNCSVHLRGMWDLLLLSGSSLPIFVRCLWSIVLPVVSFLIFSLDLFFFFKKKTIFFQLAFQSQFPLHSHALPTLLPIHSSERMNLSWGFSLSHHWRQE